MTDEVLESTPIEEESPEPVVPEISTPEPEDKPTSVNEGLTEARLNELLAARDEALTEKLSEVVSRSVQSQKDRRIGKLETKLDELMAAKEQGLSLDDLINEQAQAEMLDSRLEAALQAKLQQIQPQPTGESWEQEWARESQKVLDKAQKRGVNITREEYNTAMFNNGVPFQSKGDAYAALNDLLVAKAKGEAISISAVATEGGDVAQPPAPPAPAKSFQEQFNDAKASGDQAKMRELTDKKWEDFEKLRAKEAALAEMKAAGISPEELLEE